MYPTQTELRRLISDDLDNRINYILNARVKEELLSQLKLELQTDIDNKFAKLEALDTVIAGLKKLFGEK